MGKFSYLENFFFKFYTRRLVCQVEYNYITFENMH